MLALENMFCMCGVVYRVVCMQPRKFRCGKLGFIFPIMALRFMMFSFAASALNLKFFLDTHVGPSRGTVNNGQVLRGSFVHALKLLLVSALVVSQQKARANACPPPGPCRGVPLGDLSPCSRVSARWADTVVSRPIRLCWLATIARPLGITVTCNRFAFASLPSKHISKQPPLVNVDQ